MARNAQYRIDRAAATTVPRGAVDAGTAPRVWALTGPKGGDNAQVLALARALGRPFAENRLSYNALHVLPNVALGASLASLDRARSDPLAPPWPDLVVAVGRRSVPVARWVRQRSGGRARLVQIGRPRAPLDWFDLVITTPQYGLPDRPNVIRLTLPLVPERAAPAGEPPFAALPRPWIALLIGGPSGPWRLDGPAAAALGRQASDLAQRLGGALLVTTSRRTPPAAADALAASLTAPTFLHAWRTGDATNPYAAMLALADALVVTSDSVSMIADAVATGRPAYLAEVPLRRRWHHGPVGTAGGGVLIDAGIVQPPRDLARVHRAALKAGMVLPWPPDGPLPHEGAGHALMAREAETVVARVRALVEDAR
jgi:uncharacterized protein